MQILFVITFLLLLISSICFVFYSFEEKKGLFKYATLTSLIATLLLSIYLILETSNVGFLQNSISKYLAQITLLIYFIAQSTSKVKWLGVIMIPTCFILLLLDVIFQPTGQNLINLNNTITFLHVVLLCLSFCCIFLGFAQSILYFRKFSMLKNSQINLLNNDLPPLMKLQKFLLLALNIGWIFMTCGLMLSFWNNNIENLDSKIIYGFVLWLFYSILFILANTKKISIIYLCYCKIVLFMMLIVFLIILLGKNPSVS